MRFSMMAAVCVLAVSSSAAVARPSSPVTQFCGDRYCPTGMASVSVAKVRAVKRKPAHGRRMVAAKGHPVWPIAIPIFDPVRDATPAAAIVAVAKSQIGNGAVYGRSDLWCAKFLNYVLERAGYHGTGSDMADSFERWGHRVRRPIIGAIALMHRGRHGGHVGVVSGFDAAGDPIIISGNHGNRVAEARYARGRVYAYMLPNGVAGRYGSP